MQERIAALHEASKVYTRLYSGREKKALRDELRLGLGSHSDAERASFAALERDHSAYRRYKSTGKLPPPMSNPGPATTASSLSEVEAELAALHPQANAYRREYLAPGKQAARTRLDAGDGTPEELERFRALRHAYQRYQNTYIKSLRMARRGLKLLRDRFEHEYLGPDNAAKRQRLEAGAAGGATAAELEQYQALRSAYEDYEAKFGRPSAAGGGRDRGRAAAGGVAVGSAGHVVGEGRDEDLSPAEWEQLKTKASTYQRDFLRNSALKRVVEAGGGTAAQQAAFRDGRAAYNAYQRHIQRRTVRVPRRRLEYPALAAAEVATLEALRSDYLRFQRWQRLANKPAAQREKFMAELGAHDDPAAAAAELERLRDAAREYKRVYNKGLGKARRAEEAAAAAAGGGSKVAPAAAGPTRGDPEWMRFTTPEQRRRLDVINPGRRTFRRLQLWDAAKREAFLANDVDGAKRAQYEAARQAEEEYQRIYRGAKRAEKKAAATGGAAGAASQVAAEAEEQASGTLAEGDDIGDLEEAPDESPVLPALPRPLPSKEPEKRAEWVTTGRRRYFQRNFQGSKPGPPPGEGVPGEGKPLQQTDGTGTSGDESEPGSKGDNNAGGSGTQLFRGTFSPTPSEVWSSMSANVGKLTSRARQAGDEILAAVRRVALVQSGVGRKLQGGPTPRRGVYPILH
jgi:hypothetical protein